MAQSIKAQRQALGPDDPARRTEKMMSELVSASLDLYRGMRDAASEAQFFLTYGNMFSLYLADKHEAEELAAPVVDAREIPYVKDALASIAEGGYNEAFARIAYLITRRGDLPLSRVVMRQEMMKEYSEFLPELPLDQWRRVRGEQEIIARYEPDQAIATLPVLLAEQADRERMLALLNKVMADKRVQAQQPTPEQLAAVERIRAVLSQPPGGVRRLSSAKRG
jgi:hypothetical protein